MTTTQAPAIEAATEPPAYRDSAQGWGVVLAGMVGLALGLSPLPFYTIGMFAPELAKAFGWTFTQLMTSVTVQSLVVVASGPVAGIALDRYGSRRVALVSVVLFGLCFMSLALANGTLWIYYAQWVLMSALGAGTLTATWTRVINSWFDRQRGLALGVVSAGTGLTAFMVKPLTAWLIGAFGWRVAIAVVGALPLLVALPLIYWLFREPPRALAAHGASEPVEPGATLSEALRDRRLWIMALSFLLLAFALTATTPNMENILKTHHFTLPQIGGITAFFGLAVIAGRVGGGLLLDRLWAPGCALIVFMLPAVGNAVLAGGSISATTAILAIIGMGLGTGFEFDLLAYLIARYFGRRQYGTIYGVFYIVIAVGGGLGPAIYGYIFDRLGTYALAMWSGVGCILAGSLLLLTMGPYPEGVE
ncbi:MFS transporter [Novosphingobium humi]|uniref:MFS transporter n=1 Tax=Novosphingobium humi TaxID=2282397 RepID=A0ABY7U4I3_9SPHN|nr:MFS transporter [Novosphingobium humi]WCT79721.1 MFS transporter [Novosphingobium humi]